MAKFNAPTLTSLENDESAVTALNEAFADIQESMENTVSRDGTLPNEMDAELDMNGYNINNLAEPTEATQAATKAYVDEAASLGDAAALAAAVTDAETAQAAAEAAQAAAEAAADSFSGTSVTSLLIEVASKAFTTQADKLFAIGMYVMAASDADPQNYMHGQVTDYTGTVLTVNVTTIGGSGTLADWTITLSAPALTGPAGDDGDDGAAGAAGADYTADAELLALSTLTATPGLVTQTADNVFTTRVITGTSNKITVTDGDGVAGAPTLTVGGDILQKNVTNTMTVGVTHTPYDHGTLSGTTGITPLPSLGALQIASIAALAVVTITAPTAESGMVSLLLTNAGAPTSVTFASFDKTLLGATFFSAHQ